MQISGETTDQAWVRSVVLEAYARIADASSLTVKEAADLAGIPEIIWMRAKLPDFAGKLTRDQLLRLIAAIGFYKALEEYFDDATAKHWLTASNTGQMFGGLRPTDTAITGGLPQILLV